MYCELVKTLLEKHFGPPRKSLSFGDNSIREYEVYYYSLANEKQIESIRELLEKQQYNYGLDTIPSLEQKFKGSFDDIDEIPQCACFSESNGRWRLRIYEITGVRYHKDNEGRVIANILLDLYPSVRLFDDEDNDFFGYWRKDSSKRKKANRDKEGFSYWLNKTLWNNHRFRNFTADFFEEVGEIENKYILKDVARSIKRCGFFLPEISFNDILKYRTPSELINSLLEDDIALNIDFNKLDLNISYLLISIAALIDNKDWTFVSQIDTETLSKSMTLKTLYNGINIEEFIRGFYVRKYSKNRFDENVNMYAKDYLKMCAEMGEKPKLSYSLNGLRQAHDDLSYRCRQKAYKKEFNRPLISVPSKFDLLNESIINNGLVEFERIITTERLFNEGDHQHNCVFSRRSLIRKDRASVYHWDYKGKSYTIQFVRGQGGLFYVDEVRARFNQPITKSDLIDLRKMLKGICVVDDSLFSVDQDNDEIQRQFPDFDGFDLDIDDNDILFDLPF